MPEQYIERIRGNLRVDGKVNLAEGGTVGGATRFNGTATLAGGAVLPYGTVAPTLATNGQLSLFVSGTIARLAARINGTTYAFSGTAL